MSVSKIDPDQMEAIRNLAETLSKPKEKKSPGVAMSLILIAAALAIAVPIAAWRAYAFVTLWGWFIEPMWPTLWHPTIYSATGVLLVINLLMPHAETPEKTASWTWITPFALPAFSLVFGYLWLWLHWWA